MKSKIKHIIKEELIKELSKRHIHENERLDEMARVVEQSDYSDKVMLVQDNDDRVAVLLTENGSKGDELLYTVDHVVFALEASFDDLGYILDEVLGGHDERGYITTKRCPPLL